MADNTPLTSKGPNALLKPLTPDSSQVESNLLDEEDLLAHGGRGDLLPMLQEHSPANGLREISDGGHTSSQESGGSEHNSGNDDKGNPDERGDKGKETPDLHAANNYLSASDVLFSRARVVAYCVL